MKMPSHVVWVLMVVISFTAGVVHAERDAVVVGCPLPLGASYGQNGLKGITLATEEINAAGGIQLGDKKLPIKLEVVDTGDLDPKVSEADALSKVEGLITDKKVDVLVGGPNRSEYAVATMDVIAKHNVVHVASSGNYTPKWVVKFASDPAKYRKSFRTSGNIAWYIKETRDLMGFLKKEYGFNKVFILIQDTLMCRDAAGIVKKFAAEDGWEVVGPEAVPSETTDYTPYLQKCKDSGAQLLFLWNYSPNTGPMFEQWRNMEVPALPMGYVEVAEDPHFWRKTRGKCAYSIITLSEAGVTPSDVTPKAKPYYEAYENRWGAPPRGTSCAASYEAMYVLKDAVERAKSLDTDALVKALEQTDLTVVRGQLRFDKNHHALFGYDPKTSLLGNWAQWQEGQRVTIWPQAIKAGDLKIPPWLTWQK
ncbi:MAG: ABC transporter substrate-binding protein [Phycisphaerae bacterium]|nr:ABC transporter substrate-binding protein [Phycisphaerae bacterium]